MGWKGSRDDVLKVMEEAPEGKADLALPVFRWSKSTGMRPDALAKKIAESIQPAGEVARVFADGGFVNFTLDARALTSRTLRFILDRGDSYGHGSPKPGLVCVEHTSANPTGPLHVGRSRCAIIGDTFARVLRASGHQVVTQYYMDDVGRQAAMLVWIWSRPTSEWPAEIRDGSKLPPDGIRPPGIKPDLWYGRAYPPTSEYIKGHPDAASELKELTERLEHGKVPPSEYRKIPTEILQGILASVGRMNVTFDEWVWESDFILDGSVDQVAAKIRLSPRYRREEDGAEAVEATDQGLPKESPLVYFTRADGTHLYPARDVAYHQQKFARFDRVIDVLGSDHKLHARGMLALLDAVGQKRKPEVLLYEFINLPEGRMSTRAGRVVNLDDLLDEAHERALSEVRQRRPEMAAEEAEKIAESVGSGAVRFHILRVQPEKTITFRWEEALSFEGKSAPFVQYALARAGSLLRRAAGGDDRPMLTVDPIPPEAVPASMDPKEAALVRVLSQLPGNVERVAASGAVHALAVYAHEVAERFNEFYQAVRVLDGEAADRPFRLALVAASYQVLKNTLELIGVDALERM